MKFIQISEEPYVHIVKKGVIIVIIQVGKGKDARVFDRDGNDVTIVKEVCDSIVEHGRKVISTATIRNFKEKDE